LIDHYIAARGLSVIDLIGIIIRHTAYHNSSVNRRQYGNYHTKRRGDDPIPPAYSKEIGDPTRNLFGRL
jgi:hypothetical protein